MQIIKPTRNCGELRFEDIGTDVILCGWVDTIREHGKVNFLDLRDRYGITQITVIKSLAKEAFKLLKQIRVECCIAVKGEVTERPQGTKNDDIATGHVEVLAKEMIIVSECDDLPFTLEESTEVGEELRLRYRYLDLRRRVMLERIVLKHSFYRSIRTFLSEQGFLEVETPFLTSSTPEGARDFLVPSRLAAGGFYALPQSPQLFKQILMVSGIDKYFQIVRCFRDEDLRADRQPEFTQLDLEASFVTEEDIFALSENMLAVVLKEVFNVELSIPFQRISYKQAIGKYNSDKPDLSSEAEPIKFVWITDFPLFIYDEEQQRWSSEHHPFTAPAVDDLQKYSDTLGEVSSRSYDLVLNGSEIASGSIRIHSSKVQKQIFEILNISEQEAQRRFGFLLDALKFGAPPHGGIAFGVDRMLCMLTGTESIRDFIPFPKTQRGYCPLTNAPGKVDGEQLKELHIELQE